MTVPSDLLSSEWFWKALAGAITAAVIFAVLAIVAAFYVKFHFGDGATRARRRSALLSGSIACGVPFELSGISRGAAPVALHVDLHFSVPWDDVTATLDRSGIWFEFELRVGAELRESTKLILPRDRFPKNRSGKRELMQHQWAGGRTHVRSTSLVTHLGLSPRAALSLRGVATALPESSVHALYVWVG